MTTPVAEGAAAPVVEKKPETPAVLPVEKPAVAAPAVAAKPAETAAGDKPAEPRVIGDDDEPKPGERIAMSSEALAKRIARANKAQLKEQFGTDDPTVLKNKLDALKKFEDEAEERRKAQLTKEQQLEERARAAEEKAELAEARAMEVEETRLVDLADGELREALKDVIKPKLWRHARTDFAEHLAREYGDKINDMKDAEREKAVMDWATQYVKDNPEFAAVAPKVEEKKDPVVAVPLKNGVGNVGKKPVVVPTVLAGKTLKPGQPNSMTNAEVAEWKRAHGFNY
jgi:hypothetical protein